MKRGGILRERVFPFAIGLCLGTIAICAPFAVLAGCTARDREAAARGALDAVDHADKACTDLHEVLHRDAGAEAAP